MSVAALAGGTLMMPLPASGKYLRDSEFGDGTRAGLCPGRALRGLPDLDCRGVSA